MNERRNDPRKIKPLICSLPKLGKKIFLPKIIGYRDRCENITITQVLNSCRAFVVSFFFSEKNPKKLNPQLFFVNEQMLTVSVGSQESQDISSPTPAHTRSSSEVRPDCSELYSAEG